MEYDKSTTAARDTPESKNYSHESQPRSNGRLRVKGPVVDTSPLAQPITFPFSSRTAKNRFLKAPMTERLCHWNKDDEDINARGFPSEEYTRLYERWGEGEIGVIVAGNVMIRYDALEAYGNPILCDDHDNRVAAFRRVADAAKKNGSLFIAQLSHPGRQGGAALNPNPVSASDVQLKISWAGNSFNKPRPLTVREIKDLVKEWGNTAALCYDAGFDGVQVHMAHGYLLAQFLSLTTNKRTDEYGGSLENRSRIVFEIIEEVRSRVTDPSFIICVKINSVEFQPGGQTPEDCRSLCVKLEQANVDFIDMSGEPPMNADEDRFVIADLDPKGGTFEGRAFEHKKESTKARESYFIEFAEMLRPLLKKTMVYVTGGFRTASGMVGALRDNACDGVGIARPLGAEPLLCKHILEGRVQGAIENFVPLPQNTQATGTQLHQAGKGDALISDWSDENEVRRWVAEFEKETKRREAILPKIDSSGYPILQAQSGIVYSS